MKRSHDARAPTTIRLPCRLYYSLLAYTVCPRSPAPRVWRPIPYRFHRLNQSIPAPITSRFRLPQPGPQIMATWPDSGRAATMRHSLRTVSRYRVTPRVPRACGKTERSRAPHGVIASTGPFRNARRRIYFPRDREARLGASRRSSGVPGEGPRRRDALRPVPAEVPARPRRSHPRHAPR